MRWPLRLLLRFRSLFRRDQVERELADEFAFHLDHQIRENIERGMSPSQARAEAMRAFGGLTQLQEECRDMRLVNHFETTVADVRQAVRGFRKHPGFTVIAILTLALGIGASTALFGLVNAIMLRPLPVAQAERVVIVWENDHHGHDTPAPANYVDWRAQNHTFVDMAAAAFATFNLTGDGEPERLNGRNVTANFFTVLGVNPAVGRLFSPSDENQSTRLAVLSYGLWQRRFGSDPQLIGRNITLNAESYTVVGVAPPGFQFPSSTVDLWIAPGFTRAELADRGAHMLIVAGRLKQGVSLDQARADIGTIAHRLEKLYPNSNKDVGSALVPLRDYYTGDINLAMNVLLAAVGALLLVVCANVAHLFLARGAARRREVAMRAALGASRARIARQMLTECAVLSVAAAILGAALSASTFHFLARLIPTSFAEGTRIHFDPTVFAFTAAIAIFTAAFFGIAPAVQAARLDLNHVLKLGSGKGSARGAFGGFQAGVIAAEVALTVLLLIGGSLLVESYVRIRQVNPGFRAENILTMETSLPAMKYSSAARRAQFFRDVTGQAAAIPGVISADYVSFPPLAMKGGSTCFFIEGRPRGPGLASCAYNRLATAGYIRTIGVPLLRGRFFDDRDTPESSQVVVINQTLARTAWPDEDPIGARIQFGISGPSPQWYTIIGIVGDVKESKLDAPLSAETYFPATQSGPGGPFFWPRTLVVRTAANPLLLAAALRRVVASVDPDQPVANVRTMNDVLDTDVANRQTETVIVAAFAILALLLASVGLYGVLSYTVAQRRTEIGIRTALGAQRGEVIRAVTGQALRWTALGVLCGVAGALALTRLLAALLYNVSPLDARTFAGATLVTLLVAALASFLPARRAANADPLIALRQD